MATKTEVTIDQAFRACADPTRLKLLMLLLDGELCVCDLVRAVRMSQPKVSRHLAYLRRAGLVRARREGQWVYYRLAAPVGEFHRALIACLAACCPAGTSTACCPLEESAESDATKQQAEAQVTIDGRGPPADTAQMCCGESDTRAAVPASSTPSSQPAILPSELRIDACPPSERESDA